MEDKRMRRLLPLLLLLLPSCHHHNTAPEIVVDVSEKRMWVDGTAYKATTARRGVGNVPGSRKTPLGTMVVIDKWAPGDPRYHGRIKGYKLHLGGRDCPPSRRVYAHAGSTSGNWSQGCVHLSEEDMREVYERVPVGTKVLIQQ